MRNPRQALQVNIHHPVPDFAQPEAAALWWRGFGAWPARRSKVPEIDARHGIVALSCGTVAGVAGIRDAQGGFLRRIPRLASLAYRPAPSTEDLVIDGIIVRQPRRGTGRALTEAMVDLARQRGLPGLRAEVRRKNRTARRFYASMGFVEVGRGRYGWPWSGQVLILRRPVGKPD